uniref:RING-type domain-containing protein n=1 Tax=Pygocentrus nattereri TaxID=42514 RepID=A0A3B4DJL7_PYGNA
MEAIEQTLKCPVCMDFFTDPVLLPCGHNFCRTCIHTVWNMDGSGDGLAGPLFCPECQIFLP